MASSIGSTANRHHPISIDPVFFKGDELNAAELDRTSLQTLAHVINEVSNSKIAEISAFEIPLNEAIDGCVA